VTERPFHVEDDVRVPFLSSMHRVAHKNGFAAKTLGPADILFYFLARSISRRTHSFPLLPFNSSKEGLNLTSCMTLFLAFAFSV